MVKSTEWYRVDELARLHRASLPLALETAGDVDGNHRPAH